MRLEQGVEIWPSKAPADSLRAVAVTWCSIHRSGPSLCSPDRQLDSPAEGNGPSEDDLPLPGDSGGSQLRRCRRPILVTGGRSSFLGGTIRTIRDVRCTMCNVRGYIGALSMCCWVWAPCWLILHQHQVCREPVVDSNGWSSLAGLMSAGCRLPSLSQNPDVLVCIALEEPVAVRLRIRSPAGLGSAEKYRDGRLVCRLVILLISGPPGRVVRFLWPRVLLSLARALTDGAICLVARACPGLVQRCLTAQTARRGRYGHLTGANDLPLRRAVIGRRYRLGIARGVPTTALRHAGHPPESRTRRSSAALQDRSGQD